MSTTESPLTDILAQLRARTEAWAKESAAARVALAEEVAHARNDLASETPETAAHEAESALAALRAELSAANTDREHAEAKLADAAREIAALRTALGEAETQIAAMKAAAGTKVDAGALAAAQAALAQAKEDHAAAMATRDAELAALKAAVGIAREESARLHEEMGRAEAAKAMLEKEIAAFDAQGHKLRMGTILVEAGILTQEQLEAALAEQAANPQRRVGAIVVERGYTSEEVVARILAAQLRLPYATLAPGSYDAVAAKLVSGHLARLHKAVPIQKDGDVLLVAMANPLDLIAIEDIEIASRCRVEPIVATKSAIEAAIAGLG